MVNMWVPVISGSHDRVRGEVTTNSAVPLRSPEGHCLASLSQLIFFYYFDAAVLILKALKLHHHHVGRDQTQSQKRADICTNVV